MAVSDSTMPPCADDAWWSEEDNEWVHGERDDESRLTGLVRYWNEDKVFISDCEHRAGKPHGRARRYYADGSIEQECHYVDGVISGVRRILRPASSEVEAISSFKRLHHEVVVYECHYEDGDLIGTMARDSDGNEIAAHSGERVPERPPGVPKTASHFQQGWLFMRRKGEDGGETLETREFYDDGTIHRERLPDGTNRSFHPGGALASEGQRVDHAGRRPEHGWWRYGDTGGFIRRESRFEYGVECVRRWHRPLEEAGDGPVHAEGPVMVIGRNALESGEWCFTGAGDVVTKVRFGESKDEEALLRDVGLNDDASDEGLETAPGDAGPAARIARLRLAGRRKDPELLSGAIQLGAAWRRINIDGDILDKDGLLDLMNALLFRPPLESLARLTACLFARDRPRVALDLVDAALCLPKGEGAEKHAWDVLRQRRVSYLRALGEEALASVAIREIHGGRALDGEAAMLLRLRAEPENNDLRLEFGALIAETEPDHAALIRLDCGDATGRDAEERAALLQRIQKDLPETLAGATDSIEGGFFELDGFNYLQGEDFLAHHEALFRWAPLTKRLDLWFASDQMAELAVLPSLCRYTTLNFWDALMFQGRAAQLARSRYLAQLEVLGLYDSHLYDEDLLAVLSSTAYPVLRDLDISNQREGQDYTFEGFKMLAQSVFAPTLEVLKMNRRYFSEDITPVLEALPRLHHLEIEGLDWGDAGLLELAGLGRGWTSLKIDRCGVGAAGVRALSESEGMNSLTFLDIGSNKLGEEALNSLLGAQLTKLKSLRVQGSDCGVSEAFGRGMIEAPMAASLEELDLTLARLGPRGAVALSKAPLNALRRLKLSYNAIGDEGAKALARSASLGALRFLDLGNCDLSDEGGKAFAESPHLENLAWLELGGAELSAGVRNALKKRFGAHVYFKYPWNRR